MKTNVASLEILESRIAPAAVFTFTDVDGDTVTVKTSKGASTDLAAIITPHLVASGLGQQLREIDFSANATVFAGTTLTITAKRGATGGDGFVNVGYIDAADADGDGTALDLGAVSLAGDLGRIAAGDATTATPGLKSLTVQSLGRFGTSTGAPDLVSTITGALSALTVKGDVKDAYLNVVGGVDAKIGAITIGGSLIGGSVANAGRISAEGDLGPVKIGGDIVGGAAPSTGYLSTGAKLASVTLGGSLIGGSVGPAAGFIYSIGDMGMVKIGHDVRGSTGQNSAEIACYGNLAGVTIGGSFIAGSGNFSGYIVTPVGGKNMGPVKIGGDIRGGDGISAGWLLSGGKMASVTVGGSVIGGAGQSSGQIKSMDDMGPVKIGRDVRGGAGLSSAGIESGGALTSLAIGGSLIGGVGMDSGGVTAPGGIGAVKITGSMLGGDGEGAGAIFTLGDMASVTVGGSISGGIGEHSGVIASLSDLGPMKIGGDVRGGSGEESGAIYSSGNLRSFTVGGSMVGGAGADSGHVFSDSDLGPVKIGGDVRGGSGSDSGGIFAEGKLSSATIGGSLIGGTGNGSGSIQIDYSIGPVKIGGDIRGGSNAGAGLLRDTGCILGFDTHAAGITVGGSIIAGTNTGGGTLARSGAIAISGDIASLTVTGSLVGNRVGSEVNVVISARGILNLPDPSKPDVAIGKVNIGGRVELAQILAGYDYDLTAANADAQIGAVTIKGDWIASSIAAGVVAGGDGVFGTMDDAKMTGMVKDNATAVSKIASILIKGQALGTVGGMDNFGFVAQHLGSIKVGPTVIPLLPGAGNDFGATFIGATGDLVAGEVGV